MKIDATSVPSPSKMERVTTKGQDEGSHESDGFLAVINRLTTSEESVAGGDQGGHAKATATSRNRDDSTPAGSCKPSSSEAHPEDSPAPGTAPFAVSLAPLEPDMASHMVEQAEGFFTGVVDRTAASEGPSLTPRLQKAAAVIENASDLGVSGCPAIVMMKGGGPGTTGLGDIPASEAKDRFARRDNESPRTDIENAPTGPSVPIASSLIPKEPQAEGTKQNRSGPASDAHNSAGSSSKAFALEGNIKIPRNNESAPPSPEIGLRTSGRSNVESPVYAGSSARLSRPEVTSVSELAASVAGPLVSDCRTSRYSEPPVNTVQQDAASIPGLKAQKSDVFQSSISDSPAIGQHPLQGAGADANESSWMNAPAPAFSDTPQVTNEIKIASSILMRYKDRDSSGSDSQQTGNWCESKESAESKVRKEGAFPEPATSGSKNPSGTASEALPSRLLSAQVTIGKDPLPSRDEAGVLHKSGSTKDPAVLQHSALGNMPAGEASSGVQFRPVPATPGPVPEVILQLAERLQVQIQRGESQIRVQLKPESLGLLEIRAENGIDGIVGRITTESSRVREYLENNLHILQQSLQDQGLRVDRIEVVLQDAFDARQPNAQQQSLSHGGKGRNGEAAKSPSSSTRIQSPPGLSSFALDPMSRLTLGPDSTFHTIA